MITPKTATGTAAHWSRCALMIMLVSGIVGVLAGLAAVIPVGMAADAAGAASWGVAVGLISGLAAAMVTGLSVAGGLHALVSDRH